MYPRIHESCTLVYVHEARVYTRLFATYTHMYRHKNASSLAALVILQLYGKMKSIQRRMQISYLRTCLIIASCDMYIMFLRFVCLIVVI